MKEQNERIRAGGEHSAGIKFNDCDWLPAILRFAEAREAYAYARRVAPEWSDHDPGGTVDGPNLYQAYNDSPATNVNVNVIHRWQQYQAKFWTWYQAQIAAGIKF